MNETKIDYLTYATNAKLVHDKKLKWKPALSPNFLEHTLPILSSIPLKYNEANKISTAITLKELSDIKLVHTPNGDMTGKNIVRLVMFLYYCKRGDLIHGSQNKNPRLAALTPLLMYAHKLYNNIPYSSWEPSMYALGMSLAPIIDIPELPTEYDVIEHRTMALTFKSGPRTGELSPVTGYKCNIRRIGEVDLPNIAMIMLLQLWIAHASLRDTSSMILDPVNWDNVPYPLDAVIPNKPIINNEEDIPWR